MKGLDGGAEGDRTPDLRIANAIQIRSDQPLTPPGPKPNKAKQAELTETGSVWSRLLCKLFGHVPALNELNDRVCSRCGADLTG